MGDSDDQLVARVARGDREACRELVERHLARVLAFATRVLADRTEAEDVAQEVFTRVWTHAASWRPGRGRFTTWLFRVALNLCLDRRARRRDVPLDAAAEPVDPRPTPARDVEDAQVSRLVAREVQALPERQRVALALCHYEGLPGAEAASVMGISVEACESLLARARRTLRARILAVAPDLVEVRRCRS
jgi:RNA polymerase sigma-70 factor (ECF subfamily)